MPKKSNDENLLKKEDKENIEIKSGFKSKKKESIFDTVKVKLIAPKSYSIGYNKIVKDKQGRKYDICKTYNFKADEPIEIDKDCYESIEKGRYGNLKFEVVK